MKSAPAQPRSIVAWDDLVGTPAVWALLWSHATAGTPAPGYVVRHNMESARARALLNGAPQPQGVTLVWVLTAAHPLPGRILDALPDLPEIWVLWSLLRGGNQTPHPDIPNVHDLCDWAGIGHGLEHLDTPGTARRPQVPGRYRQWMPAAVSSESLMVAAILAVLAQMLCPAGYPGDAQHWPSEQDHAPAEAAIDVCGQFAEHLVTGLLDLDRTGPTVSPLAPLPDTAGETVERIIGTLESAAITCGTGVQSWAGAALTGVIEELAAHTWLAAQLTTETPTPTHQSTPPVL